MSINAKACPHCGAPSGAEPDPEAGPSGFTVFLRCATFALVLLGVAALFLGSPAGVPMIAAFGIMHGLLWVKRIF